MQSDFQGLFFPCFKVQELRSIAVIAFKIGAKVGIAGSTLANTNIHL